MSTPETEASQPSAGFIFLCTDETEKECMSRGLFGATQKRLDVTEIQVGAPLFLFQINKRLLFGNYEATSAGGLNIVPEAWGGQYPAQVKFRVSRDVAPLTSNIVDVSLIRFIAGTHIRNFRTLKANN